MPGTFRTRVASENYKILGVLAEITAAVHCTTQNVDGPLLQFISLVTISNGLTWGLIASVVYCDTYQPFYNVRDSHSQFKPA